MSLSILPRTRFDWSAAMEMGRHEEALGSLDRGDLDDVVPRRTGTVSEIDCEPEQMRRCEMNLSGRTSETSQ